MPATSMKPLDYQNAHVAAKTCHYRTWGAPLGVLFFKFLRERESTRGSDAIPVESVKLGLFHQNLCMVLQGNNN